MERETCKHTSIDRRRLVILLSLLLFGYFVIKGVHREGERIGKDAERESERANKRVP